MQSINKWQQGRMDQTVGVRQRYLFLPVIFNIFLENIMSDALEEHDGKAIIDGILRFADDIVSLAEEEY